MDTKDISSDKAFNRFLKKCTHKHEFTLYGVNTLPDNPAHFWGKEDYSILDCYLEFAQEAGSKGPYTIYVSLQIWVIDHMGPILFDELNLIKNDIIAIIESDEEGNDSFIYRKKGI